MPGAHGVQLWVERNNPWKLMTLMDVDNKTIFTRPVSALSRVPGLLFFSDVDELDAWLTDPDLRLEHKLVGFSTSLARSVCGWTTFTQE